MTISSKFKVTSMQVAGGNAKVSLNIPIEEISDKTLAELTKLPGNYMTVSFMPESLEVITMVDESGNPTVVYSQDKNGQWAAHKQEQQNLMGDEQLKEVSDFVAISDIDEFILHADYVEFVSDHNPVELIDSLNKGLTVSEIAKEQECSASILEEEISGIRKHFAPYALAAKGQETNDESKNSMAKSEKTNNKDSSKGVRSVKPTAKKPAVPKKMAESKTPGVVDLGTMKSETKAKKAGVK